MILGLLLVAWFSWLFLLWDRINLLFFLLFSLWDILLVRILEWLTSNLIGLLFLGILLRLHHFFHVYIAPNFWAKVLTIISHNMQVRNEISDRVFRHCKLSHHLTVATWLDRCLLGNTDCNFVTFCNNQSHSSRPATIAIVLQVPSLTKFLSRLDFMRRILILHSVASLKLRRLDRLLMLIRDIYLFLLILSLVIIMFLELILFH